MFVSEKPSTSALLSAGRHLFLPNGHVSEKRDLKYGSRKRHKLDIYEPNEINEETELIFFIHGGGWASGSKDLHTFIGRSWASENFIVAIPNYRLVPDVYYPKQLEDVVLALFWLQDSYNGYNGSLYLAGHSAGAHMASLIGFSEKWRKEAGLTLDQVSGFVLLAGVYQFYPYDKADPRVKRFVGDEKLWQEAQPINYIGGNLPPVFLAHGTEDREVLPKQSIKLREKLAKLDVANELLVEDGVGHLELLLETSDENSEFWVRLQRFFDRVPVV